MRSGYSTDTPAPDASAEALEGAQRELNCETAKRKYATLTQTERRVITRDEYGNEQEISAEEIESAAAVHKAAMEKFCD